MSLECSHCEHDVRGGHAEDCDRPDVVIARLRAKIEQTDRNYVSLDKSEDQVMLERDSAEDALQETHLALGGDGEWPRKMPPELPPHSGDLRLDVPALAAELSAELARLRDRLDKMQHGGLCIWCGAGLDLTGKSMAEAVEWAREHDASCTANPLRARAAELEAERAAAFVAGAKWWEYTKAGATMWGTDVNKAEAEAERRWPGCWDSRTARGDQEV